MALKAKFNDTEFTDHSKMQNEIKTFTNLVLEKEIQIFIFPG